MSMQTVLRQWQRGTQYCLDVLFPPRCSGCQRSGHLLCPDCTAQIQPLQPPFCQSCGVPLLAAGTCKLCRTQAPRLNGIRAMAAYQEPLRSCIHALKYSGQTRLAEPLGLLLAQGYSTYRLQADIIIPVPLHHVRQKQRGYNHAQLLAEVCARQAGVALRDDLLVRQRATDSQVGLRPDERQGNVQGAFICTPSATEKLRGHNILIIDDVCTTGATLEACAAPLFEAGTMSVWSLVLARVA